MTCGLSLDSFQLSVFRYRNPIAVCSPLILILATLVLILQPHVVLAQGIESPSSEKIFHEDRKNVEKARKQKVQAALQEESSVNEDLDFNAPDVYFDQEKKEFQGKGGVVVSQFGVQIQADQGSYNTETKEARLSGNTFFNAQDLSVSAQSTQLNLETETGSFESADVAFEEGGYRINCNQLNKVSEFDYELGSADFTTCGCQDESRPWSFHSSSSEITEEGYARLHNVTFRVHDVPIFYTPYLLLPAKRERASGLLFPSYGYSSEDGFQFSQPIFLVLDDYSDLTVTPFTEVKTRTGSIFDYRKIFSKTSDISSRLVYSDESARDGDLRGTNVSGLADPTFEEDRFGGYYRQHWKNEHGSYIPLTFIADGRYVSDDLFLRELKQREIGESSDRFVTSTAVMSAALGDYFTADLSAEYNQALIDDDDTVLQRLPEFTLSGLRSFRTFGVNPYGLKLVTKANVTTTQFARDEGYDGMRTILNPSVKIPFHYRNYFNSEFRVGANQNFYSLDETTIPGSADELDRTNQVLIPNLGMSTSTVLERVYDVAPDGPLPFLTSLGSESQFSHLTRVKHQIEPLLNYTYIPDISQGDLPSFDSRDRIRERSLFGFGVRTTLLGRFDPIDRGAGVASELTPRVEDLPVLAFDKALSDPATEDIFGDELGGGYSPRRAAIRELAVLTVKQTYDYAEDHQDNDPDRNSWSDVGTQLDLFANNYFATRFESNFDPIENQFSSWGLGWHLRDDRGDAFISRYSYIDNEISQIEGNLELALTKRVKLGFYGNYDQIEKELLEQRIGLRFSGGCDCWEVDLGYHEQLNPDKEQVRLTVKLAGLGNIRF